MHTNMILVHKYDIIIQKIPYSYISLGRNNGLTRRKHMIYSYVS